MGGEDDPDFVVVAFGVEKVAPWQHIGPLEENDFQGEGPFLPGLPSLQIIGQYCGNMRVRSSFRAFLTRFVNISDSRIDSWAGRRD